MTSRSSRGRAVVAGALRCTRIRTPVLAVAVFCLTMTARDLLAVQTGASVPDTAQRSAIFDAGDAALFAALITTSVVLLPVDAQIQEGIHSFNNGFTRTLASGVEPLGGSPFWFQTSAATFVGGKVIGNERMADLGLHALMSLALANAVTGGLKRIGGRSRPSVDAAGDFGYQTDNGDPYAWRFFGGWEHGSRRSYPSNHAATAFVLAGVASEEFGGAVPWVAYPVAGAVAWSRIYDDAHWASDVVLGALVGIFSSRLIVGIGHRHPGTLERLLLLEPEADQGAMRVGLKLPLSP